MEQEFIKTLLVTANCGSVFEEPKLLEKWIEEFVGHVKHVQPDFIGLHLQEVGGKTYEKSMEYVQKFIQMLCEAKDFQNFDRIRVFLDEDYNSAEHFTALGNLYFISKSVKSLKTWNFLTHEWEPVDGKNIHTGNIETVPTKEKSKFPQNFFPECKWSRKGFLRTRWSVNGSIFDLVNIHLFHDASNLAACQEYPSVYCKSRRRALLHTLERFHQDDVNVVVPYFIFGDFNFRCDTEGVIKELTENLTMHRVQNVKSDNTKVHYRNSDGDNVLTVGKKEFSHSEHQTKFKEQWLRKFDLELEPIKEFLYEYPIKFAPSYPYEENSELPNNYMSTRCPSWCDRVLISPAAKKLIIDAEDGEENGPVYGIIGENICMGDHKPVYLSIRIKIDQGIVSCYGEHENSTKSNASDTQFLVARNNNLIINNIFNHKNNNNNVNHVPTVPNIHSNVISVVDVQEQQQQQQENSSSPNNVNNVCLLCRAHFMENLARLYRQDNIESNNSRRATNNANSSQIKSSSSSSNSNNTVRSPISIHVIDAENLSVCMCSLYNSRNNSDDNLLRAKDSSPNLLGHLLNNPQQPTDNTTSSETNNICPICRNIIKKQPIERRTLISKRLLLANDIIVNRIDSHYLNTFSGINLKQDPYTPESPDFDSPYLESDSSDTNRDNDSSSEKRLKTDDDDENLLNETQQSNPNNLTVKNSSNNNNLLLNNTLSSRTSGGVSPTQLKSRLERLQQLSPECSEDETIEPKITVETKIILDQPLTISDEVNTKKMSGKKDKNDAPCCTGKECCIL